jgi:hypothetical protein
MMWVRAALDKKSQQEAKMDDSSRDTKNFTDSLLSALLSYQQSPNRQILLDREEVTKLSPLHARLQKVLDTISLKTQANGLSLLELQVRMKGRKGGMPHVGELAAAFRKLGWIRRRQWSDSEDGFRAKWYPN